MVKIPNSRCLFTFSSLLLMLACSASASRYVDDLADAAPSSPQLTLYAQKFDEFQGTLAKSNQIYARFKTEMDNVGAAERSRPPTSLLETHVLLRFSDDGKDDENGKRDESVEKQIRELQQSSDGHDGGGRRKVLAAPGFLWKHLHLSSVDQRNFLFGLNVPVCFCSRGRRKGKSTICSC